MRAACFYWYTNPMRLGWFLFVFVFFVNLHGKSFNIPLDSAGLYEVEIEADPYYSAVDLVFAITQAPIPHLDPNQEMGVYSYLFQNLGNPRFGVLEVSVNPLPLTGSLIQLQAPSVYRGAQVSSGLNLIGALTKGFPEPWAFSYFLGNVVDLKEQVGDSLVFRGRGFGGALLSIGNYHILENRFIQDYWGEGELKLKGSSVTTRRKMSWSFRIGGKVHGHQDIYNSLYFAIKRDRVDFKDPLTWNWKEILIRNSEIEARADIRIPRQIKVWKYITQMEGLVGKKWPSKSGDWAFSLSTGLQLQFQNAYRGALAEGLPSSRWAILVRPNIVF